jgi:uncharacterized BrkB/YihY/UPF0761 family membrane protein
LVEEREILSLVISLAVLVFAIANHRGLSEIPRHQLLFASFAALVAAWVLSVLEGFFLEDTLNLMQHILSAGSAIVLLVWCCLVLCPGRTRARS